MRAVVCGAGIAGLAVAGHLQRDGWEVTVLERAAGPREQGYMLDFFGPGFEAAEETGLLPRLRELEQTVDELAYVDRAGRRRAGMAYDRFTRALDGRLVSLLRPDLERALRERVADRVDLRFSSSVASAEELPAGVRVTTTEGRTQDADLLVGADGVHSRVRRLVVGEDARVVRYLGLHTAAYSFRDAAVHAAVGRRFCLTDTPRRTMGFYGLRDGRVATFAVHRSPDPALPEDARAALREEYAGLGWVVPRALALCPPGEEVYYDRVAQVEAPQWHRGRVVLVGDACSAVSLLAGQGSSLAVAGARVLAEELAAAPTVPQALAAYQRRWQPLVTARQRSARANLPWFLPPSHGRVLLRRAVLRLASVPGVDRYVGRALTGATRGRSAG